MGTKRYSGEVTISINYEDVGRDGQYSYSVSTKGRRGVTGVVKPPAAGFGRGIAYDSPQAYDASAHAALSFAMQDAPDAGFQDLAWPREDGSGWQISRTKPVRRVKNNRAPSSRARATPKRRATKANCWPNVGSRR